MKNTTTEASQFAWHYKPAGWSGAPCPICGCPQKNLRAKHRALKADETWLWDANWIKRVSVSFGGDTTHERIGR